MSNVTCSHCNKTFKDWAWEKHQDLCKRYKCEYCSDAFNKGEYNKHVGRCPKEPRDNVFRRYRNYITKEKLKKMPKPSDEGKEPHFTQGGLPSLGKKKP